MNKMVLIILILLGIAPAINAKDFELRSPDGKNELRIQCDNTIRFTVWNRGEMILSVGSVSMEFDGFILPAVSSKIRRSSYKNINENIRVDVPVKFKNIVDSYNELTIDFREGFQIVFRAYDNGVAYRFVTNLKNDSVRVKTENVTFNNPDGKETIWPYEGAHHANPFLSHFEYLFKKTDLKDVDTTTVGLPLYFTSKNHSKIIFTETDLFDYPNLFIKNTGGILQGRYPHIIQAQEAVGDRGIRILQESEFIAVTSGKRSYPWRLWTIDQDDAGVITNTLPYQLATPSLIQNTEWIKPGKVAWDWWNANNLYNVDFKSGINNNTYKYYIDFASRFGLEYIILDEGWSKSTHDLMNPNPDIDVPELVRYGKEKNVGVILWVLWNPLDEKMDAILDLYASWGVKGIKVDFMARAEQYMVNFYTRTAKACAERKLLVDFHGAYKPTGLQRTYPNVMTFEGVHGLENDKWEETITPDHDLILPFTRMVAGPMDYTPGAMHNAVKGNFKAIFTQPMSMGTRAHQAAMYVVYESPLQMLADSPSNYYQDENYTGYISRIPAVWDDTKVLFAEAGRAVLIARKHGDTWYIGGMTNWEPFRFDVPLDFIGEGDFDAEILTDGINANRVGSDYKIEKTKVNKSGRIHVDMASGGGLVMILNPVK